MKKMLYLMNVDWNWIKQRPHFLAEKLKENFDIIVVNQKRYSRKNLQQRKFDGKLLEINTIPRIDRYRGLKKINIEIKKNFIRKTIRQEQPEYIYITMPEQINWIPLNYEGKIIYDCMDDHYGLTRNKYRKIQILEDEEKLLKKADYIFISSEYLYSIIKKRYGNYTQDKSTIVLNGFDGTILSTKRKVTYNSKFVIAYFGTISDWFDFDLILKSLDNNSYLEYWLIGPLHRNIVVPSHKRLKHLGIVEHDQLFEITKHADAFIMPFILDDSIRAVDPVKLYEYINFDKIIICIDYPEVRRFANFVDFYMNFEELDLIIKKYSKNKTIKYSKEQREKFLQNNSWSNRKDIIVKTIGGDK